MSEFNVTDCLVLKLKEYDVERNKLDNTMFILYDMNTEEFVIRGQRDYNTRNEGCTYSFQCKREEELVDFIDYMIDSKNPVTEILYNCDNLPYSSNDITFEDLQEELYGYKELSGYDNQLFTKSRMLSNLKILKNMFNYYN